MRHCGRLFHNSERQILSRSPQFKFDVEYLYDRGRVSRAASGDNHLLYRAAKVASYRSTRDLIPGCRHTFHWVPVTLVVSEHVRVAQMILAIMSSCQEEVTPIVE